MKKVAIIGVTGLVGQKMLEVLEERDFPIEQLIPVASSKSVGSTIDFKGKEIKIIDIDVCLEHGADIALFSAGASVSKAYAKRFNDIGCIVIDNSSAFRMDENVPLIVPEVNGDILGPGDHLISNPNCSTIQMVVALVPLHKRYGIERIVISTYQSVTGTGVQAVDQLYRERSGDTKLNVYPHPIDMNCFPHGGEFDLEGNTSEEIKLILETQKIMRDSNIKVSATVVRVPVTGGHSESINVQLKSVFDLQELKILLAESPGVTVLDDPTSASYPTPLMAEDKDDVFVGRIRRDDSIQNGLNLWVVSDNLRKGAATNAVQIAEMLP